MAIVRGKSGKSYKILLVHTGYGCDTGCCGHILEVDGREIGGFDFMHDAETPEGAKERWEQHVPEDCRDTIDWTYMALEECC